MPRPYHQAHPRSHKRKAKDAEPQQDIKKRKKSEEKDTKNTSASSDVDVSESDPQPSKNRRRKSKLSRPTKPHVPLVRHVKASPRPRPLPPKVLPRTLSHHASLTPTPPSTRNPRAASGPRRSGPSAPPPSECLEIAYMHCMLTVCAHISEKTRIALGFEHMYNQVRMILRLCGPSATYLSVLSYGIAHHGLSLRDKRHPYWCVQIPSSLTVIAYDISPTSIGTTMNGAPSRRV